jgi:hypothetical protein
MGLRFCAGSWVNRRFARWSSAADSEQELILGLSGSGELLMLIIRAEGEVPPASSMWMRTTRCVGMPGSEIFLNSRRQARGVAGRDRQQRDDHRRTDSGRHPCNRQAAHARRYEGRRDLRDRGGRPPTPHEVPGHQRFPRAGRDTWFISEAAPICVSNSQWLDRSRVPSAHRFDRAGATERLASARLRIETDNHVRRLCDRVGFKTIGGVGGSLTGLLRLCDA